MKDKSTYLVIVVFLILSTISSTIFSQVSPKEKSTNKKVQQVSNKAIQTDSTRNNHSNSQPIVKGKTTHIAKAGKYLKFPVDSRFLAMWNKFGGLNGFLGSPTGKTDGNCQYFEYGVMEVSPNIGKDVVLILYNTPCDVVFLWGSTTPYNYDRWIVRWWKDANPSNSHQEDVPNHSDRMNGTFTTSRGFTDYSIISFIVEGVDLSLEGSNAKQGWSSQISISTKKFRDKPVQCDEKPF